MLDTDVIFDAPKAASRSHRCVDVDYPNGRCHVDCADDGAIVYVTWHDAGEQDYDIDSTEGARCGECGETYCADCLTTNHPDGDRPLCRGCAETARNQFYDKNELIERANRAENELQSFLERLRVEPDEAIIRAAVSSLDSISDLVETITRELMLNRERASGAQRYLPGMAA